MDYLISLSVPTSQGILYYGYVSPDAHGHGVGGTEKYYYQAGTSQMSLSEVSFVPRTDFSGTAVISYTDTQPMENHLTDHPRRCGGCG